MCRLNAGSESGHRTDDGTAKCPESLCPRSVLPSLGRRDPPPPRTLLPVLCSYGLMRRSRWLSPASVIHLGPGVFAGCYQPLLSAASSRLYLCKSFPRCLAPYHDGPTECFYLFLPRCHRPSPRHYRSASRFPPRTRLSPRVSFSRLQTFRYVQGRGRDSGCPLPPAQSRAGAASAHGSYLGCLASKRTWG